MPTAEKHCFEDAANLFGNRAVNLGEREASVCCCARKPKAAARSVTFLQKR
jgi:hypothetical protein